MKKKLNFIRKLRKLRKLHMINPYMLIHNFKYEQKNL